MVCGTEFGCDDHVYERDIAAGLNHECKWAELRNRWLREIEITPEVKAQLANIGIEL